ncbi:MAG: NAD-binding protein [Rhodocyclaceae bacterium]|jgi:2-hydroxy-3-oxopropionate reductase|nr:NAD-binding protein [Rhodocyclaceae bacterium]MCL4680965.1 NAD-binding protein [Rhodocyclaceae bacterium]
MKLGFIGLGAMGRPMALHLIKAGHELSVYARRAESAQPLVDAGARRLATPAEVAAVSEVVFTMVTTGADVEAVALGEGGIIHGAKAGTVLVDMGTIPPGTARRIAAALAAKGIEAIDAPVSGGEVGAQNATLAIMAGGKAEVLARVRPLLERLGKTLVHVGPNGAGQVAKACNQMIMVACIEAAAEAMLLAEKSGADPEKVRLALAGGSAGSRVLEVFGARMTARNFQAGVEARLHHKDFGILLNEAVALGAPLPIAAQVWQQLNALMAQGLGREDTSSLLKVLEGESTTAARRF